MCWAIGGHQKMRVVQITRRLRVSAAAARIGKPAAIDARVVGGAQAVDPTSFAFAVHQNG
jgi:hypothetical protein